jgi:hypothetical protein
VSSSDFILAEWQWLGAVVAGQAPAPRSNHIAFAFRGNCMGVYGGFGNTRIFNDLNVLNTGVFLT